MPSRARDAVRLDRLPATTERILVVEDSAINQKVAIGLLQKLGYRADAVANGLEALDALKRIQYAAVLMDCQMPEMDGYAATAAIRAREGAGPRTPIIAMTANALAGDRDRCLAAGMDDYLSKPFSQQDLAAVIGRWMALPLAATVHHDDEPPRLPRESVEVIQRDVINRSALEKIRMLSRERGDALVQKVINAYVDDTPQQLSTLRHAIDGMDTGDVRRIAHTLKSASANVGAEALAALCKEMEHLGRADTTEGADSLLTNMEQEFEAVRDSLAALLEKET
jgi:CheY-like chemotaxis protein/HPt (histidine-containing phosphotransfer) domain-containing protein